ncbi:coiled-coil domain-containing protein 166-like [Amphiura filiformis]|uniref:coiled-coil domain-containing protein 166-like n=1 Tax=Amphiura filiformis TaxID=82378 RepID=UPI003B2185D3
MPPKKKGKGKGKKKKSGGDGDLDPLEPTEKEILLKNELDSLTEELAMLKKKVEELRRENEWLQEEAHKTRIESHEYMSYMSKKAHKRQSTIVTLSDQNQQEIRMIHEQKEEMLKEYEAKKQELREVLMERETQLAKTRKELQDLEEYKKLQEEQVQRIRDLEKEVMGMRGDHTQTIQKLKSQFLSEKREFQQESEAKIQEVAKQANREAIHCLNEHTTRIKSENRKLRQELLKLITKSRTLNSHKTALEDQQKELLREQQYAADLKRLKGTRQHKVLKSFGLLEEENQEPTK